MSEIGQVFITAVGIISPRLLAQDRALSLNLRECQRTGKSIISSIRRPLARPPGIRLRTPNLIRKRGRQVAKPNTNRGLRDLSWTMNTVHSRSGLYDSPFPIYHLPVCTHSSVG